MANEVKLPVPKKVGSGRDMAETNAFITGKLKAGKENEVFEDINGEQRYKPYLILRHIIYMMREDKPKAIDIALRHGFDRNYLQSGSGGTKRKLDSRKKLEPLIEELSSHNLKMAEKQKNKIRQKYRLSYEECFVDHQFKDVSTITAFITRNTALKETVQVGENNQDTMLDNIAEQTDPGTLDKLIEILLHREKEKLAEKNVILLLGPPGSGRSTLLDQCVRELETRNEISSHYVARVRFRLSAFPSVSNMLMELVDQLHKKLKSELQPSEINQFEELKHNAEHDKKELDDCLAMLLKKRTRWVFFMDNPSIFRRPEVDTVQVSVTDFNITKYVEGILNFNRIYGLNIRIVVPTNDFSNFRHYAYPIRCQANPKKDLLEKSGFDALIQSDKYWSRYFNVTHFRKLLLVDELLKQDIISNELRDNDGVLASHKSKDIRMNFLDHLEEPHFSGYLYNFLKQQLSRECFQALRLCAIPDDEMEEVSLIKILSLVTNTEMSMCEPTKTKMLEIKNQFIKPLRSCEGFIISKTEKVQPQDEDFSEVYRVQPYIRKVLLDNWKATFAQDSLENFHDCHFAAGYYGLFIKEDMKKTYGTQKRYHKVRDLDSIMRSAIHSTHLMIKGLTLNIADRNYFFDSEKNACLKSTTTVLALTDLFSRLSEVEDREIIKTKFLLMQNLFDVKAPDVVKDSAIRLPTMLSEWHKKAAPDHVFQLYTEFLRTSIQLKMYDYAAALCQFINLELDQSEQFPDSHNNLQQVRYEVNTAYFYIFSRKGSLKSAIYYAGLLEQSCEKRYLKCLQNLDFTAQDIMVAQQQYVEALTKNMTTHLSMGEYESVLYYIGKIVQEFAGRMRFISRSKLFKKISINNRFLSFKERRDIYDWTIKSIRQSNNKDSSKTKVNKMDSVLEDEKLFWESIQDDESFNHYSEKLNNHSENIITPYSLHKDSKLDEIPIGTMTYVDKSIYAKSECYRALSRIEFLAQNNFLNGLDFDEFQSKQGNYRNAIDRAIKSYRELEFSETQTYNEEMILVMIDITRFTIEILRTEDVEHISFDKFHDYKKRLLALDWNMAVSFHLQAELNIELVRLELSFHAAVTRIDKKLNSSEKGQVRTKDEETELKQALKRWNTKKDNYEIDAQLIEIRLKAIKENAEKFNDVRLLSSVDTFFAVYYRFIQEPSSFALYSPTRQTNKERAYSYTDDLRIIASQHDYKYRAPEIYFLNQGQNPFDHIIV